LKENVLRKDSRLSILISANAEWDAVRQIVSHDRLESSPYGQYFWADIGEYRALFFQGGWGKVAAAGSTQYVIDHFKPEWLINLGTCGGIKGRITRFDVVAVERAVIYDVHEAMGDSAEAITHYTTELSVPRELPVSIIRTTMYSADRDLTPAYFRELENRYRPSVVDWESGGIAWVAKRNGIPLLIIRGVTDLVSPDAAEAVGNLSLFRENARRVMENLIRELPKYIAVLRE
jgi:adenosylhomocysteine nucleosidase